MFARMGAWIETAAPLPWIFVMRVAAADRDRTGEHVTIVDVPAFLTGIGRSAAGEFGHGEALCRSRRRRLEALATATASSAQPRATLQASASMRISPIVSLASQHQPHPRRAGVDT